LLKINCSPASYQRRFSNGEKTVGPACLFTPALTGIKLSDEDSTPAEAQFHSKDNVCEICDPQDDSRACFSTALMIVPYQLSFHQYSILICIRG
jgi:hypothetical protein